MFPYRIVVEWSAEDECYVGRVPALPGCAAHGDTESIALKQTRLAADAILAMMKATKRKAPPSDVTSDFSGKLVLRLPRSLHQRLSHRASAEAVSLNQLLVSLLSERAGTK